MNNKLLILKNKRGAGFGRRGFFFLTILMLGLLTFQSSFFNKFQTLWDDQWVVLNHYTEGGLYWRNIFAIFSEFYNGQYSPINQLYYTFLFSFFGYNETVFHGFSVFIHIINGFLVFWLLLKLLHTSKFNFLDLKQTEIISFITALLFTIHPITVESVAWLSASKVLLYTFFYLLAGVFYIEYIKTGKSLLLFIVLILFAFSFGSKEQAVTLPLFLLLIDYVLGRDFNSKNIYLEKTPFFILSIIFGIVTILSQDASGIGVLSEAKQYPFYQRLVFSCYSLIEYFTKSLVPIKLSYLYPFPNLIGEPLPKRFLIYPFLFIGFIFSFWKYLKKPWIFFWVSFFVLHLVVTIHLIPIGRFTITADRYLYLSLVSPCFGLSLLIVRTISLTRSGVLRSAFFISIFFYFFFLISYTHLRTKKWRNSESIKKELIEILESRKEFKISFYRTQL